VTSSKTTSSDRVEEEPRVRRDIPRPGERVGPPPRARLVAGR
jgi:hypothetical protein